MKFGTTRVALPTRRSALFFHGSVTMLFRPPRALFVPYPLGYSLGAPNDPFLQHRIIAAALSLLTRTDVPVLENLEATRESDSLGLDVELQQCPRRRA